MITKPDCYIDFTVENNHPYTSLKKSREFLAKWPINSYFLILLTTVNEKMKIILYILVAQASTTTETEGQVFE